MDTNKVNLYEKFRYKEALTYFSDTPFWQIELRSNFKLRNNHRQLYLVTRRVTYAVYHGYA